MCEQQPDELDLGSDHFLHFVGYKEDERTGANVIHKKPDGSPCSGWIAFAGGAWANSFSQPITTWNVAQKNPLTLTPSLLCKVCGDHGFIENGKWRKA